MKGAEGPGDPGLFYDPDLDRWFMYFGSSDVFPIHGIECDFTKKLAYSSKPKGLIWLDPVHHGWERFGQDHREATKPFIEGAWMTKHGGKYYLQYAAPGTEYNVYATGTYTGSDPMGPFTYAPNNPVAYRPGGFACGIGHGNIFQDLHDNYWLTGTCWIGLNWGMERRIVMVPAGFDDEGALYSDTRFADFPHYLPAARWKKPDELFTGWMLLSYRKPVQGSSGLRAHPAENVTDENIRTYWVAEQNRPGESLTVDLQAPCQVRALQVNYIDHASDIFKSDENVYTQFRIHGSLDGKSWTTLADLTGEPKRDRPNAYMELPSPARVRYVRYEHIYVASPSLAISDFRIFGKGEGPPLRYQGASR
jgi:hypothetical protein